MKSLLIKDWKNGKDIGLLFLRLVFGFVLLYGHGWGKLTTVLTGQEINFSDPIGLGEEVSFYLAAFAEGIAILFIILGLFTRASAIILIFNFIVILFVHGFLLKDGFNVLEMRIMYLCIFIVLLITGGGKYSLDHQLLGGKTSINKRRTGFF